MTLPATLDRIARELIAEGLRPIVVGGAVRDHFLGRTVKDYDIEVYHATTIDALQELLSHHGSVNLVGKSFGVLKLRKDDAEFDFSLPRTEIKVAAGHRGFDVACHEDISFGQASRRRDFTMNAMGYDIAADTILDPYGGQEDMRQEVLRHIDDDAFVEDPLRVYRAVQFCARFGYALADETFKLCCSMVGRNMLSELPRERIYVEMVKLLLQAETPSVGFELMRALGVLRYFPELEAIINVPQDPRYHPEGDVWLHTMMVLDAMASLRSGEKRRDLRLMLAALCHDLGKATHTQITPEKISAIGHEKAGEVPTRSLLERLTNEQSLIDSIVPLVLYHLAPSIYYRNGAKDSTIRKLATRVNIQELVVLAKADFLGRTTEEALGGDYPAGDWLQSKAKELGVDQGPLPHLLRGQDLIDLGFKPSPKFANILDEVYVRQLSGEIESREQALVYVQRHYYLTN